MMRQLATVLAATLSALAVAPAASAAWVSGGSNTGNVSATSVNQGNAPTATRDDGAVSLSWTASTLASGDAVNRYDVVRTAGSTSTTVCNGATTTSCSDSSPVPGSVTYAVVPRIGQHWVGAASSSTDFQYDVFAPITTVTTRDPEPNSAGWNKANVSVTLTANDVAPVASGVSEVHYTLDGVETTVSGTSASFTVTAEQVTDITFWAVDNSGNTEAAKTTAAIKVDKTAPLTSATLDPPANGAGWNNSNVNVTLAANDGLSGVSTTEFSTNGGTSWSTYTAALYPSGIPVTAEGDHTITFRSTDVAGNTEANQSQRVQIDKTAPVTNGSLSGNTVSLPASDPTSGGVSSGVARVEYKIGSAATSYTTYTGAFTLTEGQTVYYRAIDVAGNMEAPDKSLTYTAPPSDTTGPTITPVAPVQGGSYHTNNSNDGSWAKVCTTGKVCATVTDTSGVTSVSYSLRATGGTKSGLCWNGTTFISGTGCSVAMTAPVGTTQYQGGDITRQTMGAGTWSLVYTATDSLGNVTTVTITFTTT